MESFLKLITSQLNDFWKGMDSASRKKIITVSALLLAVVVTLSLFITRKDYTTLYSNLDSKEAGEILNKLEEMKVDVKPEGNGTIMVPKNQEAKLRMQLAAEGYPKSGFNYDSSKSSLGLGATDFDKRKADQIQLQERLQTAIMTMDGVRDAIVTISIPDQDSFVLKDDKQATTASVLLKLSTDSLSPKQVKGIEELVAKSVLGLKPENISIVDSNMNALNANDVSDTGAVNSHFDMENEVRNSLQKQINALLEPVFGKGNVIASINVRLNFDKQVSEVVRFEPVTDDTGIAVSINELKEEVSNGDSGNKTGQTQYATGQGDQGAYAKNNKTINYEVNQVKDKIEKAQGKIETLTLSILINQNNIDNQTLTNVQKIVSTAMGVDTDKVVVNGMQFDGRNADKEEMQKAQKRASSDALYKRIFEIVKYIVFALIIFFVLFSIFKLISSLKVPIKQMVDYKTASKLSSKLIEEVMEMPEQDKEQIMQKRRIDTLIDTKPDIAAQQIRDWLKEE